MAKKLILHFGFPKTGSSALQIFFSQNKDLLAERGIDYPYPEPESILSTGGGTGNVIQILFREGFVEEFRRANRTEAGLIRPERAIDGMFWKFVRELVARSDQPAVLLSGEGMSGLKANQLDLIVNMLSKDFDILIVAFARDHFDYFYSNWKQYIKTNDIGIEFSEFVDNFEKKRRVPAAFQAFKLIRSRGLPFILLNYDSARRNLAEVFFRAAGVEGALTGVVARDDNRSLTDAQALLLCRVNRAFAGTSLPRTLTRVMLGQPAGPGPVARFYRPDLHQKILDRYRPTLEAMNEVIVDRPISLQVRSTESTEAHIGEDEIRAFLAAYRLAHESLPAPGLRAAAGRALSRLRRIRPRGTGPRDFDAAAYLFHNADVAAAGVDPLQHYVQTGWIEKRHYRYM